MQNCKNCGKKFITQFMGKHYGEELHCMLEPYVHIAFHTFIDDTETGAQVGPPSGELVAGSISYLCIDCGKKAYKAVKSTLNVKDEPLWN